MGLIYVTRHIPEVGTALLEQAGHEVTVSEKDGALTREELLAALSQKPYDAVLSLLTDQIDQTVLEAVPQAKIVANYAVGFNNIDLEAARAAGVVVANTPVQTDSVAEYTMGLMLALMKRIPESERFTRAGYYQGWDPSLSIGADLKGKTLGILGAGQIGAGLARMAHRGFGMPVIYHDIHRSTEIERAANAAFVDSIDGVLTRADVVSVHVPLSDATYHLLNKTRLQLMKPSAYLINTARGKVIDEAALVAALQNGTIRGAALDVHENEPALTAGLAELENVILTPHIGSSSQETRDEMARLAAANIVAVLNGETAPNQIG